MVVGTGKFLNLSKFIIKLSELNEIIFQNDLKLPQKIKIRFD